MKVPTRAELVVHRPPRPRPRGDAVAVARPGPPRGLLSIAPPRSPLARQIGERIKSLRLHARGGMLTQEHVAELAGISMSFLSMIERGGRMPHIETLASLAVALEVPLDELFREKENRVPEPSDAAVRRLAEFVQAHRLTRHEVNRLLAVAETIFES